VRENGKILALAPGLNNAENAAAEKHENMQCLLEHIERMVPLEEWEFQQSAKLFVQDRYPVIIYNSPKCRVRFSLKDSNLNRWKYDASVLYGRLHAPNDKFITKWKNEDCYCWHGIQDFTLPFLEGLSPSEANNRRLNTWQEFANDTEFLNSGTAVIQQPIRLHTRIWNKYGNRLFDLFDLNNSKLWSQYAQFAKEYYDIRWAGQQYKREPEFHKIC
jgi:hypothetical protein